MAIYSFVSRLRAEMTEPYVPLPISLIVSYLTGNSNMMPLKSVHANPGIVLATGMPLVYSVAAAEVVAVLPGSASIYCTEG